MGSRNRIYSVTEVYNRPSRSESYYCYFNYNAWKDHLLFFYCFGWKACDIFVEGSGVENQKAVGHANLVYAN